MIIKTHRELADHIAGKTVLHLNSLGKDSAVCLEWLAKFARPARIVAVNFKFLAENPDDKLYLEWQKKRYPNVEFISDWNGNELSNFADGTYQSPFDCILEFNKWEYGDFDMNAQAEELREKLGLDFISLGHSRYESIARATKFHKKGLVQDEYIFPIGMMSKAQVTGLIRDCGIKVHPTYKLAKSTLDYPSYYKMRSTFLARPGYRETVRGFYPLITLDEYRYKVLFGKN